MVTGRNKAFRLSGSSVLPAYPGFIVINIPDLGSRAISLPSKINFLCSFFNASYTWPMCFIRQYKVVINIHTKIQSSTMEAERPAINDLGNEIDHLKWVFQNMIAQESSRIISSMKARYISSNWKVERPFPECPLYSFVSTTAHRGRPSKIYYGARVNLFPRIS